MENTDREYFERKDPLWVSFHELADSVKERKFEFEELKFKFISLATQFLKKYSGEEDLKEIIVAFESLKNDILYYYGSEATEWYESSEILEYFDSLIFEHDYEKMIDELKKKLNIRN